MSVIAQKPVVVIDLTTPDVSPKAEGDHAHKRQRVEDVSGRTPPSLALNAPEPAPTPAPAADSVPCESQETRATVDDANGTKQEEDDLVVVGSSGDFANYDFPHAYHHCRGANAGALGAHACCSNCYCYVCDVPCKECEVWHEHKRADDKQAKWKAARAAEKKRRESATVSQSASSSSAPAAASSAPGPSAPPRVIRKNLCEPTNKLYEAVTRPFLERVEYSSPHDATKTLHLIQGQTVAFMETIEQNGIDISHILRDMQSRCRTSMYNIFRDSPTTVHSGFVLEKTGVGKTIAVGALMQRRREKTIVIVPAILIEKWFKTLMQWTTLKVCKRYTDKDQGCEVHEADVLLCAFGTNSVKRGHRMNALETRQYLLNWSATRLVVDESSQFFSTNRDNGLVAKFCVHNLSSFRCRWMLDATPFEESNTSRINRYECRMVAAVFYPTVDNIRIREDTLCESTDLDTFASSCVRHVVGNDVVPPIRYEMLNVTLSDEERRIYDSACILDDYICSARSCLGQYDSYQARLLAANGNYSDLRTLFKFNAMHTARLVGWDLLSCRREFVQNLKEIDVLLTDCQKTCNSRHRSVVMRVIHEMETNPSYKAVVVADDVESMHKKFKKLLDDGACTSSVFDAKHLSIWPMPDMQGRTKTRAERFVAGFNEMTNGGILICTRESCTVGIDLQSAQTIFYMEPKFASLDFNQIAGRVRRFGSKYDHVKMIVVVSEDTVHDLVCWKHSNEGSIQFDSGPVSAVSKEDLSFKGDFEATERFPMFLHGDPRVCGYSNEDEANFCTSFDATIFPVSSAGRHASVSFDLNFKSYAIEYVKGLRDRNSWTMSFAADSSRRFFSSSSHRFEFSYRAVTIQGTHLF